MPPLKTELPILTAQSGPLSGQRWQLENELVIGRDPSCGIVINDRQVSRYHTRLERLPEGIQIEDLGSKNGTYVNGMRVEEPFLLADGDLIQVALVQHFLYQVSDTTMPLDTMALPTSALATATSAGTSSTPLDKLRIETRSRRVWVKGREIVPPLSLQQFRLLEFLQSCDGQVVTRQDLIDEVWGQDEAEGVSEQAFDALVRRLRDRLAQFDPDHNYIVTVRGHGLRLEIP